MKNYFIIYENFHNVQAFNCVVDLVRENPRALKQFGMGKDKKIQSVDFEQIIAYNTFV